MRTILKIACAVTLVCLAACETKPQQRVTYMRGPAENAEMPVAMNSPMQSYQSTQQINYAMAPMPAPEQALQPNYAMAPMPPQAQAAPQPNYAMAPMPAPGPTPDYGAPLPPGPNYAVTSMPAKTMAPIASFYAPPSSPLNPLQQPSVPPLQGTTSSQSVQAAYGDPNYRGDTPRYYPPVNGGVHVSR